jgi:phage-related protein
VTKLDKPIAWLHGEIKTPPMSKEARFEIGHLLRRVQGGEKLSMPISRPLPSIDPGAHELRVKDIEKKISWRVVYFVGAEDVVVLDVFPKRTKTIPKGILANCKKRLSDFIREENP